MTTLEAPVFDETRAHQFSTAFASIRDNIQTIIRGKQGVVELTLLAMMSGGHILLEDVPGVGKTLLAKALGASVGAHIGRIQFTPDLLPADVTGISIWNRNSSTFEFRPGPIFTEVVLADEINRASPKTQSALLEAMAESQVTVDGSSHDLPSPFMVIATQNPIEQEGTYPLPEAQLDRFLMKISVGYPSRADELQILHTHELDGLVKDLRPVVSLQDVAAMGQMVNAVHIANELRSYLIDISEATRNHPAISLGVSPRGTLSLQKVARARAASQGRTYTTDDDIKSVAPLVLGHRIVLKAEAAMQGANPAAIITEVLRAVPVPRDRV